MSMFKLSKASRDKITVAAKRIDEPAAALTAALDAYNEVASQLRELARNIENDWQAAWDERSERWQESAAGQTAAETIAAWATLADDFEDIEVEIPEIVIPG